MWVVFSCFFECLAVFDWMQNLVHFNFWCVGYFCILVNMIEFCSRMQLNSLKTVLSFWVLLLQFVRRDQVVLNVWANYSQRPRQDLYVYFPKYPMNLDVFNSGWWKQTLFQPYMKTGHCYYWSFGWILPQSLALFSNASNYQCLAEYLRETLFRYLELHLCVTLSSLVVLCLAK